MNDELSQHISVTGVVTSADPVQRQRADLRVSSGIVVSSSSRRNGLGLRGRPCSGPHFFGT